MKVEVTEKKLKSLIKISVREILGMELMKLRALLVPAVSLIEQDEIEKKYGEPERISKSKAYRIKV